MELKNLGRHCSEYLARQSNLAAVNALKERSLLGQEDHPKIRNCIEKLEIRVAHYFVFRLYTRIECVLRFLLRFLI